MSINLRSALSNIDLENILKHDMYCKQLFIGVYPIDQLPTTISRRPAVLIFNFDKATGPGTHWGALVLKDDSEMTILYFESFGKSPLPPELVSFLNRNGRRICISRLALQENNSSVCGVYAALFIIMYAATRRIAPFFDLFSTNKTTLANDNTVVCTLQNYLHTTGRNRRGVTGRLTLTRQYCQPQSAFRLTHRQPATQRHYRMDCTDLPLRIRKSRYVTLN